MAIATGTAILAGAVISAGVGMYEGHQAKKAAQKGVAGAQGAMIDLFESWGGEEGMKASLESSGERLEQAAHVTGAGFREASALVSKTKRSALARVADTERQIQLASERRFQQQLAVQGQKGGILGMSTTAGAAAGRAAAADAALLDSQAALSLGGQRAGIEQAAGAGQTDLALKGAGAQASILGAMSSLEYAKATKMSGMEEGRANMLAGFASTQLENMPSTDLSGFGEFVGYMTANRPGEDGETG